MRKGHREFRDIIDIMSRIGMPHNDIIISIMLCSNKAAYIDQYINTFSMNVS